MAKTRTEIKDEAQSQLLDAMMSAFYQIWDGHDKTTDIKELERQYRRIEKFLGWGEHPIC